MDINIGDRVKLRTVKEEIEGIPLGEQIKDLLDILERFKNKLQQILDGLPKETLNELIDLKKEK